MHARRRKYRCPRRFLDHELLRRCPELRDVLLGYAVSSSGHFRYRFAQVKAAVVAVLAHAVDHVCATDVIQPRQRLSAVREGWGERLVASLEDGLASRRDRGPAPAGIRRYRHL